MMNESDSLNENQEIARVVGGGSGRQQAGMCIFLSLDPCVHPRVCVEHDGFHLD